MRRRNFPCGHCKSMVCSPLFNLSLSAKLTKPQPWLTCGPIFPSDLYATDFRKPFPIGNVSTYPSLDKIRLSGALRMLINKNRHMYALNYRRKMDGPRPMLLLNRRMYFLEQQNFPVSELISCTIE